MSYPGPLLLVVWARHRALVVAAISDSEIVLGNFKVFVSNPCLNGMKRDAVFQPSGRA
jgi:hypothetical protein